jgi:hypothetical protein
MHAPEPWKAKEIVVLYDPGDPACNIAWVG